MRCWGSPCNRGHSGPWGTQCQAGTDLPADWQIEQGCCSALGHSYPDFIASGVKFLRVKAGVIFQ